MPARKQRSYEISSRGNNRSPQNRNAVLLDNNRVAEAPSATDNDLYIGRLLTRTSGIVRLLKYEFDEARVIEAHGQLVLPYMWRRQLAGQADSETIINAAYKTLKPEECTAEPMVLSRIYVANQRSGTDFSVRLSTYLSNQDKVQDEINLVTDSIRAQISDMSANNTVTISTRVYETPSEADAEQVASRLRRVMIFDTSLTMPTICGVPKKN